MAKLKHAESINESRLPVNNGRLTYRSSDENKRVTLIVPSNLDLNVEMVALFEGKLKTAIITEALHWYLQRVKGIPQPSLPPTMTWSKPDRDEDSRENAQLTT